jgi:hypothetical protein
MSAAGGRAPRFYVDETSIGLGKVLSIARKDVVYPGHPDLPEVPPGTLDIDWMPAVAKRNLVVIGRDKRIRIKPVELAALKTNQLRVFHLATRRDLTTWGYLVQLVPRWNDIEQIIANRGAGPWFYAIHETRITEVAL